MVTTGQRISWSWGTAYDFFISLTVLHNPTDYDIRPTWASGVRARIPAADRQVLEAASSFIVEPPYTLLDGFPEPRDASAVLARLAEVPESEILPAVAVGAHTPQAAAEIYRDVAARGTWNQDHKKGLVRAFKDQDTAMPPVDVEAGLSSWASAEAFGSAYLRALGLYYEIFFEEEEKRLRPALQAALKQAQDRAAAMSPVDLLESLTRGLRFGDHSPDEEWILVPSFWVAPVTMLAPVEADRSRWTFCFNARPPSVSLVPGEFVPDALLQALQAISDPTRLRILRLLQEEPLTPSQLARRLRLRLPTVTHHLKTLRHAAMVQVEFDASGGARYATRMDGLKMVSESLESYVTRALAPDMPLAQAIGSQVVSATEQPRRK
jgi:DNA-binding transcriptional ArsR family regulator